MRAARLFTCLWPGLPALWWQGALAGVFAAVAFGFMLNGALMVTFLTPEMLSPLAILGVWLVVTAVWIIAWFRASRRVIKNPAGEPLAPKASTEVEESPVDAFPAIQLEYLRGNHAEAAELLNQHLKLQPADADARMLLATLLRHSEKYDDAKQELETLEQVSDTGKWSMEIYQERQLIAELLEIEEEEREEAAREIAAQETSEEAVVPFPQNQNFTEDRSQEPATAAEQPLIAGGTDDSPLRPDDEDVPPSVKAA